MASFITAGNATNGLQVSSDNTGILELRTGTGSGTTAVTFSTGQRATFPSTISVGNTTPATTGAGITFPAAQSASSDANTLDDYEEGTWTPTAYGLTTTGVTTYATQAGAYTKIGNQVTVWFYLNVTNMTGTGALAIGGLPFTQNASTTHLAIGAALTGSLDYPAGGTCAVAVGTASANNFRMYVSGDNIAMQAVNVDAVFDMHACATYYV